MRECLGWLTSCENEQSCPQNWLEHAVTEIPRSVECHVCKRSVELVNTNEDLDGEVARGGVAAFPVVPPIGLGPPTNGAMDVISFSPAAEAAPSNGALDASALQSAHVEDVDPVRAPTPMPVRRHWVCTLANGETIRVDKESMTIGRSRACDVVIPSAKVSRQHASLSISAGELWIEDLGSANGVWHNGEKVTRTKVADGDTFTISDETLLFEVR